MPAIHSKILKSPIYYFQDTICCSLEVKKPHPRVIGESSVVVVYVCLDKKGSSVSNPEFWVVLPRPEGVSEFQYLLLTHDVLPPRK